MRWYAPGKGSSPLFQRQKLLRKTANFSATVQGSIYRVTDIRDLRAERRAPRTRISKRLWLELKPHPQEEFDLMCLALF